MTNREPWRVSTKNGLDSDLGRGLEIAKWVLHPKTLQGTSRQLKPVSSDSAIFLLRLIVQAKAKNIVIINACNVPFDLNARDVVECQEFCSCYQVIFGRLLFTYCISVLTVLRCESKSHNTFIRVIDKLNKCADSII